MRVSLSGADAQACGEHLQGSALGLPPEQSRMPSLGKVSIFFLVAGCFSARAAAAALLLRTVELACCLAGGYGTVATPPRNKHLSPCGTAAICAPPRRRRSSRAYTAAMQHVLINGLLIRPGNMCVPGFGLIGTHGRVIYISWPSRTLSSPLPHPPSPGEPSGLSFVFSVSLFLVSVKNVGFDVVIP